MTQVFNSIEDVKREYFPIASRDPKETGDCAKCNEQRRHRDLLESKFIFTEKHDDIGECGKCIADRCLSGLKEGLK